jgi:hypothetical protein
MACQSDAQTFVWFEDLSAGIGGVVEGHDESVVVAGLGMGLLSIEVEYGALSAAERCRRAAEPPDNCYDTMVAVGLQHRFHSDTSLVRPFVNVLGGTYWSGTGEEDTDFQFEYGALQVGGGLDVRRPSSRHGMRLSLSYRRVYTEPRRDQLRFLVAYLVSVAVR